MGEKLLIINEQKEKKELLVRFANTNNGRKQKEKKELLVRFANTNNGRRKERVVGALR